MSTSIEAINGGNVTITGNGFLNPGTILAGVGGEVHLDNITIDNVGGIIKSLGAQSLVAPFRRDHRRRHAVDRPGVERAGRRHDLGGQRERHGVERARRLDQCRHGRWQCQDRRRRAA